MATLTLTTVTLDSPHPERLASFYAALLHRQAVVVDPTWAVLRSDDGSVGLAFALADPYTPPVWPNALGEQMMQVHLEIQVDDLAEAVAHALACGATLHTHQPQDDVRVCLDPDGHPFCLWIAHA